MHADSNESQKYQKKSLLGGFAGLLMEGTLHPLDTVRTRMKANTTADVPILVQMKEMYRREGVKSYFRGQSCTLTGAFICNTFYFYTYESLKDALKSEGIFSGNVAPFVAAFFGGFACDFLYLPFDVIRARMQLEPGTYHYKHVFHGLSTMWKEEGTASLRGCGAVYFALSGANCSLTFGFYELFRKLLKPFFPHENPNHEANIPLTVASSIGAAILASYATNPLEVLLTRKQTMHHSTNTFELIKNIYKKEGPRGFMKGVSGTALYYVLSYIILFPTYEVLKSVFNVDLSDD